MANSSITQYINNASVQENIQAVLRDRAPQFITSVVSLVNSNEKLKEADPKSVMSACLTAAALNLPINQNLGLAYIIPYDKTIKDDNGKATGKETIAQFQMGYKGFIQLAMRSGQFETIHVTDIREGEIERFDMISGDVFFKQEFSQGSPEYIENRDAKRIVGYLSYMKLKNGFKKMKYMTVQAVKKHALQYSQTFKKGYGKWSEDFDGMAKKTVLKLLLAKFAPLETNSPLAQALESDQALITESGLEYPDNRQMSADEEAQEKERVRISTFIANAKSVEELMKCAEAVDHFPGVDGETLGEQWSAKKAELDHKK